jgi:LPXTG-motif cell wall-anchored protein
MKIFFLIFFIALGALDFLYGVLYKDQLSIIAGGAIVAITVYIWKKKKKEGF